MTGRVLFVSRSSSNPEEDIQFQTEKLIADELAKSFDLESSFDLSHVHSARIASEFRKGKRFEAMVTHIPPVNGNSLVPRFVHETRQQYFHRCYEDSLSVLREVKLADSCIAVIGYSSAIIDEDSTKVFIGSGLVNEVVSKSHPEKWLRDYEKISFALRRYVGA